MMKNTMNMDDLGVALFQETSMLLPKPTFDQNPQDLPSTILYYLTLKHDLHPPNTPTLWRHKDCSLLLLNNPDTVSG